MTKVLENLEVVSASPGDIFRCLRCGHELGPVTEGYKRYALKNEVPVSKYQPALLAPKTDKFVLREYYCPSCATMFEVEMAAKGEKETESIQLSPNYP